MILQSFPQTEPQRCMLQLHKPESQQTYVYVYWDYQLSMVAMAVKLDAMRPDTDLTLADVAKAFQFLKRIHKDAKWSKENQLPPNPIEKDQPSPPESEPPNLPKNWWNP